MTGAAWLTAALVVGLAVLGFVTAASWPFLVLAAVIVMLGLGELATWPSTRARAAARTRGRRGTDPGAEAAHEYERRQGWR